MGTTLAQLPVGYALEMPRMTGQVSLAWDETRHLRGTLGRVFDPGAPCDDIGDGPLAAVEGPAPA